MKLKQNTNAAKIRNVKILTRVVRSCVIAAASLLMGCGRAPPSTQQTSSADSRFVAIARGVVDVEGGIVRIAAPRDGFVSRVNGKIGDTVTLDDVLVVLDSTQAEIARDAARADLNAAMAQEQLLQAKVAGLRVRASRTEQAAQVGATSDQAADDVRQGLAELTAEIVVAKAGIEAAKQKLRQAEYEVTVRTIRAPLAGKISARSVRVGDAVSIAATDLVELVPDTPKIVRAELNETFVGKVAVGMAAEIRSEADPERKYGGKIVRISDVFGPSKLTENAQEVTDARDVECILEVEGAPFRVGERVQVKVLPATVH